MIEKMGSDSESLKDSKECSSSNSSYFNFDNYNQIKLNRDCNYCILHCSRL